MEPIPMEITNHKKAKMQVVKYCIIIIFTLFYQSSAAQGLQGTFYGDDGLIYNFNEDTFKTVTRYVGFHSEKEVAKGSYSIAENTLFLNYEPIINHPKPTFKFIEKEPIYNRAKEDTLSKDALISVHFKIVGGNNEPIVPQPIVQLRNKENQAIQGFSADTLGHLSEIFIFGPFKGYFYFTSLANEELKIWADTLSGYKSIVKVMLPERTTYSIHDGTKKYLIEERTEDRIVLQSLEDNKKIVLERKDSD